MGGIGTMVKVDRVSTVEVLSLGSTISVASVDGPRVICRVQHKVVTVFACEKLVAEFSLPKANK